MLFSILGNMILDMVAFLIDCITFIGLLVTVVILATLASIPVNVIVMAIKSAIQLG